MRDKIFWIYRKICYTFAGPFYPEYPYNFIPFTLNVKAALQFYNTYALYLSFFLYLSSRSFALSFFLSFFLSISLPLILSFFLSFTIPLFHSLSLSLFFSSLSLSFFFFLSPPLSLYLLFIFLFLSSC